MSSMYNCDSVAVLNYYRRNNPHKPTKKTAHFYVFCGLQKLNTLNLRLFHSPSNPRNHFSTVLIETNWYTISCKYENCSGLTSISIGNSVTRIGHRAFSKCKGLTTITIPNNVNWIGNSAFSDSPHVFICNNEVPPSAGYDSFTYGSVAIVPESSYSKYIKASGWKEIYINKSFAIASTTQTTITLLTSELFSDNYVTLSNSESATRYYPEGNTLKITGLSPNENYTLYTHGYYNDIGLGSSLSVKTLGIDISLKCSSTNLTLTVDGSYNAGDATVKEFGFLDHEANTSQVTLEGLSPGKEYRFEYYVVSSDNKRFTKAQYFSTKPIGINMKIVKVGASNCQISSNYVVDDAVVTEYGFDDYPNQLDAVFFGLDPNKEYTKNFYVKTKDGSTITKQVKFTTNKLSMTTQQPKVISVGNVIVAAESNLDDEETNVGFEWRRTDWTDDFASNTGAAYLYEGTMEGYIRNLNAEKLWKFRPYYESNSGNRYYGDWVGLDPSNTSYFEPTVHTYAKVEVNGNRAEVKGYAMRGTDNVTSQGFKYWKSMAGARGAASDIPANAKTVEANGQVMTAQLTGLDYESDYCYVAFVTTSENETFYGEMQTFKTGVDTSGIEDAHVTKEPTVTARYDLRGRRLNAPQTGVNILKMSDGTTRKVFVK